MRKTHKDQIQIGEVDIGSIEIELDTRDEIPQILRGLQHIYVNELVRKKVFNELLKIIPKNISKDNGRNGMTLWNIFVLGSLRVSCNWDYDKLQEIANNHRTLRKMLGHGILDEDKRYPRQTLCDNVRWFTPEILNAINAIVVREGRKVLDIPEDRKIHGRCDSFVFETDVHFPTDINILWDASRKVLGLGSHLAEDYGIEGWRQTRHNLIVMKRTCRKVQKLRDKNNGKGKDSPECFKETKAYLAMALEHFNRAETTLISVKDKYDVMFDLRADTIQYYMVQGRKEADQIYRRSILGETIPHKEKIFSLFEPHTEWIVKGKAGISQELGLRVGIVQSNSGFILHHRVMQKETDEQVAVSIIKETQRYFPQLRSCSFDKGFHSPQNQEDLAEILDFVVLPRKGRLDDEAYQHEHSPLFIEGRRKHSAIESAINALENHGLDRCLDYGIDGFKRYVAMAIMARNIQLLGSILQKQLQKEQKRLAA